MLEAFFIQAKILKTTHFTEVCRYQGCSVEVIWCSQILLFGQMDSWIHYSILQFWSSRPKTTQQIFLQQNSKCINIQNFQSLSHLTPADLAMSAFQNSLQRRTASRLLSRRIGAENYRDWLEKKDAWIFFGGGGAVHEIGSVEF